MQSLERLQTSPQLNGSQHDVDADSDSVGNSMRDPSNPTQQLRFPLPSSIPATRALFDNCAAWLAQITHSVEHHSRFRGIVCEWIFMGGPGRTSLCT